MPLKSNDIKVRADGVYYIILSTCWAYEVNEVIFENYLLLHFSFRCHTVLSELLHIDGSSGGYVVIWDGKTADQCQLTYM